MPDFSDIRGLLERIISFFQDLARVINDGLFYYEDGLCHEDDEDSNDDAWVSRESENAHSYYVSSYDHAAYGMQ